MLVHIGHQGHAASPAQRSPSSARNDEAPVTGSSAESEIPIVEDGRWMCDRRLQAALQSAGVGAWEKRAGFAKIETSDLCGSHLGVATRTISIAKLFTAIHRADRRRCVSAFRQALTHGQDVDVTFRCVWHDDTLRWTQVTGRAVSDYSIVGFSFDVTTAMQAQQERERSEAALLHLANHDPLTGLANRRLVMDTLQSALASTSPRSRVALFSLDLDRFKSVNDKMGHAAGDELLVHVASRLRNCVRQQDIVARHGGDEFIVLQTDISETADIERLVHRLLNAFSEPFELRGQAVELGCSIGISLADDTTATPADLLQSADAALYRVKATLAGGYCFYESLMRAAPYRLDEADR